MSDFSDHSNIGEDTSLDCKTTSSTAEMVTSSDVASSLDGGDGYAMGHSESSFPNEEAEPLTEDGKKATIASNRTVSFSGFGCDSLGSPITGTVHRRGIPFVSRHRMELNRIQQDATHKRSHLVPQYGSDVDDTSHDGSSADHPDSYGQKNHSNKSFRDQVNLACMRQRRAWCGKSYCDWFEVLLPCLSWLKAYQWRATLSADLVAGVTVGVMIVPQSMSYAKLAGLPVEYGLYSALTPVYAYALFGSSRQLAIGPVALVSLLLSTGLSSVMAARGMNRTDDPESYQAQYNVLAIQTSFLVGVAYIVMGLCRLGFVTIFLSHAVISGFTTGAAVIIGLSQVKYIVGYDITGPKTFQGIMYSLFANIAQLNWKTFLMGTLSILYLAGLKHVGKTYPRFKWVRAMGPLSITVIAIVLVVTAGLDDKGIPVVGEIPQGLPSFTADLWTPIDSEGFSELMVVVLSIAIVGFMESIAIAKQLASKHKYEIDSSMELIGLGMANFVGGMFQSYPVTGSFSRSAVNHESGAKSGISGMVTATIVMLVLLLLTPVFELLPLNTLAAIVISGVLGLLDYEEAMKLWKVHKFDFLVWCTACAGTLFLGVEIGLAIAVGVSLLIVIYESAYPHTAVLGRLPGTSVYRNLKQYPQAERINGIVIVRIDAPLYFANAQNVRDKIRKYRLAAEKQLADDNCGELKYLIIELTPVSHIDTSALHILEDMLVNYSSRGQQLCFSNPSLAVMQRLVTSGFADRCGRQHFFSCSHDAVNWCLRQMDEEAMSVHESTLRAFPPQVNALIRPDGGAVDLDVEIVEIQDNESVNSSEGTPDEDKMIPAPV